MSDSLADILMGRNALAGDPGPDEVYGTEDVLRMMNARRGAEDHEGRSALARLLTTMVPMSMLGIRSSRGADMATGAMLDKRAERLGTYGDDIMRAGVDWPNVLAKGYGYEMRSARDLVPGYSAPRNHPGGANENGLGLPLPRSAAGADGFYIGGDRFSSARSMNEAWERLQAERAAPRRPFDVIPGGKD